MRLTELESRLKNFLFFYLVTAAIGMLVGLLFLGTISDFSLDGTVLNIRGNETEGGFDIPVNYPKSTSNL